MMNWLNRLVAWVKALFTGTPKPLTLPRVTSLTVLYDLIGGAGIYGIWDWKTVCHTPAIPPGAEVEVLRAVDAGCLKAVSGLLSGMVEVSGQERLRNLRDDPRGYLPLDASAFARFYGEVGRTTLETLRRKYGVRYLDFPGTVFEEDGEEFVLALYHHENLGWLWRRRSILEKWTRCQRALAFSLRGML